MVLQAGMRVELLPGGKNDFAEGKAHLWCAGKVPTGSIGTIVQDAPEYGYYGLHVVWDNVRPKKGNVFGINTIRCGFLKEAK
jgi:hypothetical protein